MKKQFFLIVAFLITGVFSFLSVNIDNVNATDNITLRIIKNLSNAQDESAGCSQWFENLSMVHTWYDGCDCCSANGSGCCADDEDC